MEKIKKALLSFSNLLYAKGKKKNYTNLINKKKMKEKGSGKTKKILIRKMKYKKRQKNLKKREGLLCHGPAFGTAESPNTAEFKKGGPAHEIQFMQLAHIVSLP